MKIYSQDILTDVLLCKDHEEIYTLLAFGLPEKTRDKVTESAATPTLGVAVSDRIEARDKIANS
jgi:hypothetical protein